MTVSFSSSHRQFSCFALKRDATRRHLLKRGKRKCSLYLSLEVISKTKFCFATCPHFRNDTGCCTRLDKKKAIPLWIILQTLMLFHIHNQMWKMRHLSWNSVKLILSPYCKWRLSVQKLAPNHTTKKSQIKRCLWYRNDFRLIK